MPGVQLARQTNEPYRNRNDVEEAVAKSQKELASRICKAIDGYREEHPRLQVRYVLGALAEVYDLLAETVARQAKQ